MDPGIYEIPSERYHADDLCDAPSLSASIAAKLVATTPLHAWAAHPRLNPEFEREERDIFDVGNLAHSLILEGNADRLVVIDADSWRTKAAQEERDAARAAGMVPLLAKDHVRVTAAADAIRSQLGQREDEPALFTAGKPEQTLIWHEGEVCCRARCDWLRDDYEAIDDLKTTGRGANPIIWGSRTLWTIGADVQVAFYLRGLKALTGKDAIFRFVLAETTPPYALSVVSLNPEALDFAQIKAQRAIDKWGECLRSGKWPGYPTATYFAETPAWAELQFLEQDGEALAA